MASPSLGLAKPLRRPVRTISDVTTDPEQLLLEVLASDVGQHAPHWQHAVVAEELVASMLGGQSFDRRGAIRGPDILVSRADAMPLAVELKLLRFPTLRKSIGNRTSELLASAVESRRAFNEDITLGAIFLIPLPNLVAIEERDRAVLAKTAETLLRGTDGVGYDVVLIGFASEAMKWRAFNASDREAPRPEAFRDLQTTSEALHFLRGKETTQAHSDEQIEGRARRVLLVADEWRSGRGGISTVNRELAVALAEGGVDVAVMVPRLFDQDLEAASSVGVALVAPPRVPGLTDRELLALKPIVGEPGWEPDCIIGHGRILGPYAAALQQQFFPDAVRVHVVHTAAEDLEAAKERSGGESNMAVAAQRRGVERDLAQSADLVVGIGPLLTATIRDDLRGPGQQPPVIELMPGWAEGYVADPARPPVRNTVVLVGRADDFRSKGVDIAAEALLKVVDRWPSSEPHTPTLVVRGVPENLCDEVKAQLDEIFEGRVVAHLRPYVDAPSEVVRDLAQASVVLMPSRHEGFGLAAYEAVGVGVPVLIGENSGLAHFLREQEIDTVPTSILPTTDSPHELAIDRWADALETVLRQPEEAWRNAAEMRAAVDAVISWQGSAKVLIDALDNL